MGDDDMQHDIKSIYKTIQIIDRLGQSLSESHFSAPSEAELTETLGKIREQVIHAAQSRLSQALADGLQTISGRQERVEAALATRDVPELTNSQHDERECLVLSDFDEALLKDLLSLAVRYRVSFGYLAQTLEHVQALSIGSLHNTLGEVLSLSKSDTAHDSNSAVSENHETQRGEVSNG